MTNDITKALYGHINTMAMLEAHGELLNNLYLRPPGQSTRPHHRTASMKGRRKKNKAERQNKKKGRKS